MADFGVRGGTDWIQVFIFGSPYDRWRLDDYIIQLQVKESDTISSPVLIDLSSEAGGITITDPVSRRLEVNVPWAEMADLGAGPFVFDFLFINRVTDVRDRSERHTLTIEPGVTNPAEA